MENDRMLSGLVIDALKKTVIPIILDEGFEIFEVDWEGEIKQAFPLKFMRRERPDGGYDLLDFQFDNKMRCKFVINFGVAEPGGSTTPWGYSIPAEKMTANEFRLYERRLFKKWFTARRMKDVNQVIGKVKGSLPDLFNWYRGAKLPKAALPL